MIAMYDICIFRMVAAHSEELNNLRRENATTQSATRGLQQDKSEAQVRKQVYFTTIFPKSGR